MLDSLLNLNTSLIMSESSPSSVRNEGGLMRHSKSLFALLSLTALLAISAPAQTSDGARALAAAQQKENIEGDVKGAIAQYQAIAAKYAKTDRSAAAMALVDMAEAYQKLGDTQAQNIYERVVRDYADQKDAVTIARAKLATTGALSNRLVSNDQRIVDEDGRVSPDGRFLFFTDWSSGGNNDLYVHDFATGTDRAITNNRAEEKPSNIPGRLEREAVADEPAVSKDGKQVAYEWTISEGTARNVELRVANAVGAPSPRRVYASPDVNYLTPLDWEPDGKNIAVRVEHKDHSVELGMLSLGDGSFRRLKTVSWDAANSAFLSPDGKWLAYDLPRFDDRRYSDVFVLATDGSREVHAVADSSHNDVIGWSPDGAWLLFASDRATSRDILAVAFKDGQTQDAPRVLKTGFDRSLPIGITSSGTLFYVVYGTESQFRPQIATIDLAAGKLTSQPFDLPHEYGLTDVGFAWSPNGKEIASVSRGGHLDAEFVITIRSIETGGIQEIHPDLAYAGPNISWSPDGTSFLVPGSDTKGRVGLFFVDAQTGVTSVAAISERGVFFQSPAWSPDAKRFYYARRYNVIPPGANAVTFIEHDIASGAEREIIHGDLLVGNIRVSPDGQYIATPSIDVTTNSRTILLIPVRGGGPRVLMSVQTGLTADELRSGAPKGPGLGIVGWEPDSRSVLVGEDFRDPKKPNEVSRVPIDMGEPTKVYTGIRGGGLSPDGKHIFFSNPAPQPAGNAAELWVLENFLPKLKDSTQ